MIGEKIYGFCNGFFGRDSYNDKIIEGEGKDWIVAREEYTGYVVIAVFSGSDNKDDYLNKWKEPWDEE